MLKLKKKNCDSMVGLTKALTECILTGVPVWTCLQMAQWADRLVDFLQRHYARFTTRIIYGLNLMQDTVSYGPT